MIGPHSVPGAGPALSRYLLPAIGLFTLLVGSAWVGFLASDDAAYLVAANAWLSDFPYVGDAHWGLRHTLTLPLAAAVALFGENDVSLALPTYLYAVGLITVSIWLIRRMADSASAIIASLLLATSPLLVIWSSIASVDIIEAFFVISSLGCWFCAGGAGGRQKNLWLTAAGALAALAFLTRETSFLLLVFYGLLFLFGRPLPRQGYFIMAAGFLTVWLTETALFWFATGDPLYRLSIAAGHDSSIDRSVDLAGNLILHPALDPFLLLFFNQEFMLLFWVMAALMLLYLMRCRHLWSVVFALRGPGALLVLALVWFVGAALLYRLLPLNPRYFLVPALAVTAALAVMLRHMMVSNGRVRILAVGAILSLTLANLFGIWVENRDFTFAERELAALMAEEHAMVFSDSETRQRARNFIRWAGAPDFAGTVTDYRDGDLYLHNLARPQAIPARWVLVGVRRPPPSPLRPLARKLGLYARLPGIIRRKLGGNHPGIHIYQIQLVDSVN